MPLFADITKPLNRLLKKALSYNSQLSVNQLWSILKKLCVKPILQYPNIEKPYTLFTDASYYTYSRVLTQAVDGSDDLRPIVYTSGSFTSMQQKWSAAAKGALAVYQSV